ncbi:NAD(P)/FAD-dependent oxidoreductase [Halomarina salina]|uniref:NAD(P)/FAD-dependent oxidoreductase n=1 Tax=Halomarina salina TaxID=1872699 RepID=A0ABD5RI34_9EURY|nr:NAD(P)/FAD-dependent oxidoreductase [Halomarina salina]
MSRVAVVGGGLAGLVAARRLAESGHDVELLERERTVGGRVRTVHEDGFTFDRGFQVLFTEYPAVQRELDLRALSLRRFVPGAVLARPGHRSVLSDPRRDFGAISETLFNREVSWGDKVRTLRLQRDLADRDPDAILDGRDQSIESYLADRGFSRRYVENFAAPFYGGITLDRSLSSSSLVFEYTFKMLAEGDIAVPADGMGAIGDQLADRATAAGATVRTGVTVDSLETTTDGVRLTTDAGDVSADAAVVATDPRTTAELTGVGTPTEPRSCVTQYFSLPRHVDLETGKRLILNTADERPNEVAPLSTVAPEYAPDGEQLLSATFLGTPDEDDETLATEVRDALGSWFPSRRFSELDLLRTDRVEFAQFAQPPGFRASLPDADAPDGPVVLAGDYTQWSSLNGALDSGRVAVDAVESHLETQ